MTYTAYAHFNRGYFEKDRLLFSLTVALEVNKLQLCPSHILGFHIIVKT